MEDDLPRAVASGIYPVERSGELSFAWSHPLATITLKSFDRAVGWNCAVVARGARPAGAAQPEAAIDVDGVTAARAALTNEFQAIDVAVPTRLARGLTLTISASPSYVPGPGDPRQLGVQLDRIACSPLSMIARPDISALISTASAGALFGLLFAALTSRLPMLFAGCALFGTACAVALTTGLAAHVPAYLTWWLPLALWIAVPLLLFRLLRGQRISPAGCVVLGATGAILFLQLIALLHPSKDVVDAVFHARRLGWVLDGRYYFTQPMPGGVQFPYAVGLYVSAAPFATLLRDHVSLLRIVVCVAEAIAGICVYLAVAKLWNDRFTAAMAAVLYHLAPLPYVVIGNANLTFAFGQSIAVIAAALALLMDTARTRTVWIPLVFAATSLAYLSHVAVFPLLGVTLVSIGALLWLSGEAALRRKGWWIAGIAVLSALLAIGIYYAHFPEVWSTLDRVSSAQSEPGSAEGPAPASLSFTDRAGRALYLGARSFGLPLLALALVGAAAVGRARDQMTIGLLAWGLAMIVFIAFRTVAPVDARLQRYADEFIERIYYLTLPAVAILAARGISWGWSAGPPARLFAAALSIGAAWIAAERWYSWIR
jgi:hypothetical protein